MFQAPVIPSLHPPSTSQRFLGLDFDLPFSLKTVQDLISPVIYSLAQAPLQPKLTISTTTTMKTLGSLDYLLH